MYVRIPTKNTYVLFVGRIMPNGSKLKYAVIKTINQKKKCFTPNK